MAQDQQGGWCPLELQAGSFMQDTEGQAVDAGSRNSHCSADVLSSHTIVLI